MTPGIVLVHKPIGPTSHAVVRDFLAAASPADKRPRKICHGGTLDPFAAGLLLILIEPATRLFDHLHNVPKTYDVIVRWGIETDNGDPLGQPVFTGDPTNLSPQAIESATTDFLGWRDQIPPATSAKRVGGQRAYERAHRGETVNLPPSRVYLHEAAWLSHDLPATSRLRVTVRGGFYVRALVRDLGRKLGCGAHIASLHRRSIGPWLDPGDGHRVEITGQNLLPWLPSRRLTDQDVGELRAARPISLGTLTAADWPLPTGFDDSNPLIRAFHRDRLTFLLRREADTLHPTISLPGGV